jgi:CrcB protein
MIALLLQVGLGGAIGAALRYVIGVAVVFPYATVIVNVLGSFLMGVAWIYLANRGMDRWMPMVLTGFLGGFTTFSAFSLDTFRLIDEERLFAAGGYVLGSVFLSVVALFLGVWMMRAIEG